MLKLFQSLSSFSTRIDRFFLIEPGRLRPLDGLRAMAILLVIARHFYDMTLHGREVTSLLAQMMGLGSVGVHLFFVLSGFLIGGQIYSALEKRSFSLAGFYLARTFRILPAAYVYLTIAYGFNFGWNWPTFVNLSFIGNWPPLELWSKHYWSLCVEEQFYLGFPLFLILLRKFTGENRLAVNLTLLVIGLWIFRLIKSPALESGYTFTPFQLDFLLLGVISAIWFRKKSAPGFFVRLCGSTFAPLLFVGGYFALAYAAQPMTLRPPSEPAWIFQWLYPVLSLWCVLGLGICLYGENRFTRFLSSTALRWIAVLSYSAYLYHIYALNAMPLRIVPAIRGVVTAPGLGDIAVFLTALVLIFGMALLSFVLVEKPMLWVRNRLLRSRKSAPRQSPVPIAKLDLRDNTNSYFT